LDDPVLGELEDAAVVDVEAGRLAFTTDGYVVSPLFFPGGDIGKLAVCGTVNDLAVMGAEPLWMSLGMVLEEGLLVSDLRVVIGSVGTWARKAKVRLITGDTKVVERGKCDGVYLTTAGVGRVVAADPPGAARARPGDAVMVNGFLGDHGMAIMAARSGLSFAPALESDCAPLWDLVRTILDTGCAVHAMRDLTRGGLAGAVCDLARASGTTVYLEEGSLPVRPAVRGACDLLGFDVLTVANEGKLVLFCPAADAETVLAAMKGHEHGAEAAIVGEVGPEEPGMAVLRTILGGERVIDQPVGEDLPRIC
ncbi:MAG: hydrogenase expression/formation protein HypE, partial [Actinobacteria bacterium RBG_16_64_13]